MIAAPFRSTDRRDLGTVSISDFHRILLDLGSPLNHVEAFLIAEKYRAVQSSARKERHVETGGDPVEAIRNFKGDAVRGKCGTVI